MRMPFFEVFQKNEDGSVSPLITIQVGGMTMDNRCRLMGNAFQVGDFSFGDAFANEWDLDVEMRDDVCIIRGAFREG